MCPSYKWPVLLRWRKSGDAPRSDSIRSGSLWSIFHFISSHHYSDSWKQSSILRSQWFSACPSPTLWEDKLCLLQAPAWQWMPAELRKALYGVPSHPIPFSRVIPSKEDTAGVPCPSGDIRKSEQSTAWRGPGCPCCTLWLLFCFLNIKLPLRFRRAWL